MNLDEILLTLRRNADPQNVEGMKRYGISTANTLGVPIPLLRRIARPHRRNHALALHLWDSGIHEARILASLVDDPKQVTVAQMNRWVRDLDSWDICDQLCNNLLNRTPYAHGRVRPWVAAKAEFVRRAGFVLIATLAVHDKAAPDDVFVDYLALIENATGDDRNFVKKAVNWALRQIGKRNACLRKHAIAAAKRIENQGTPSARWIAKDALRELAGKRPGGRRSG